MAFEIYKKGQGYYTRLGSAIGGVILTVLGCQALYKKLDGISTENIAANTKSWIQAGVPALLFLVLCWVIFKLVNMSKCADFMIATEGEMKKVSWSTRKEIITSTKVVIFTVVLLAVMLGVIDSVFGFLFNKIGILKVF